MQPSLPSYPLPAMAEPSRRSRRPKNVIDYHQLANGISKGSDPGGEWKTVQRMTNESPQTKTNPSHQKANQKGTAQRQQSTKGAEQSPNGNGINSPTQKPTPSIDHKRSISPVLDGRSFVQAVLNSPLPSSSVNHVPLGTGSFPSDVSVADSTAVPVPRVTKSPTLAETVSASAHSKHGSNSPSDSELIIVKPNMIDKNDVDTNWDMEIMNKALGVLQMEEAHLGSGRTLICSKVLTVRTCIHGLVETWKSDDPIIAPFKSDGAMDKSWHFIVSFKGGKSFNVFRIEHPVGQNNGKVHYYTGLHGWTARQATSFKDGILPLILGANPSNYEILATSLRAETFWMRKGPGAIIRLVQDTSSKWPLREDVQYISKLQELCSLSEAKRAATLLHFLLLGKVVLQPNVGGHIIVIPTSVKEWNTAHEDVSDDEGLNMTVKEWRKSQEGRKSGNGKKSKRKRITKKRKSTGRGMIFLVL